MPSARESMARRNQSVYLVDDFITSLDSWLFDWGNKTIHD